MTEPTTHRPLVQDPIASTRSGRAGEPTARWVAEQAAASGVFDIEVVDLAGADLPLLAEPEHPSERQYQDAHYTHVQPGALQLHVVGLVPFPQIDQLLHPDNGRRLFRPTEPIGHSLSKALTALHRAVQPAAV